MLKLKNILGFFVVFCLFGLLSVIAVVTLVDPSQFKDFIQKKIVLKTQYPIKLNGPIHWQLEPGLSIEAHDIEILSPKSSATFDHLFIKKIRFEPQILSLFTGKLWVNLEISHLNVQLIPSALQIVGISNVEKIKGSIHYDNKNHQIRVKRFLSQLTFSSLPASTLAGNFNIDHLDQQPTLQGTFLLSLPENGDITANINIHTAADFTKILAATGSLQGKKLRLGSLPISSFKTQVDFKQGLLTFDPIQAYILNSNHQGKCQIDLNNSTPNISLSDMIESPDIQELLANVGYEDLLQGKMTADTTLHSHGNTLQEIFHAMTGTAQISITDGKIKGIELLPLLQHVQSTTSSLIEGIAHGQSVNTGVIVATELEQWKRQAQQPQNHATLFRTLEAQFKIKNDILITKEFKLTHPNYTVDGHGTLDMAHQQAEYQAHAWLNQPINHASPVVEKFFKETPLSIQIQGPINALTLYPELNHYTHDAIKLIEREPSNPSEKTINPLEKLFGFS